MMTAAEAIYDPSASFLPKRRHPRATEGRVQRQLAAESEHHDVPKISYAGWASGIFVNFVYNGLSRHVTVRHKLLALHW